MIDLEKNTIEIEPVIAQEMEAATRLREMVQRATTDEPGLPVNEIWNAVFDDLTLEEKAEAFFQLVGFAIDTETQQLTKQGRHFAIEIADTMGPDWIQGVYQLGVATSRANK